MSNIQEFPKLSATALMIQWDGTPERAQEIKEWTGKYSRPFLGAVHTTDVFKTDAEMSTPDEDGAWLWVAHQSSMSAIPKGHWIVREQDGSGFYPLSPEGHRLGYGPAIERRRFDDGLVPLLRAAVRVEVPPEVTAQAKAMHTAALASGALVEGPATACPPTCACGGRGIDPETEHPTQNVKKEV